MWRLGRCPHHELKTDIDNGRGTARKQKIGAHLAHRYPRRTDRRERLRGQPGDFEPVITQQCQIAWNRYVVLQAVEIAAQRQIII